MTEYWVGVASRDHVRAAVEGGFCQLNHGKEAPLRRLSAGDRILYYSPREKMRDGDPVQAFTAAGEVLDTLPYQAHLPSGFDPFRRDVRYLPTADAPIHPLLPRLTFAAGKAWGQVLRRGTFRIRGDDYGVIAEAMGIGSPRDG